MDKPPVAEGTHPSAFPDMPPRAGHDVPVLVSSAEGSLGRCPAGSTAAPEASPLTSVARMGYTSASTNHFDGHPGLGQLQAKGHVSAAAAASPGAPSRPESKHQPEEHQTPKVGRQSNAATKGCGFPFPASSLRPLTGSGGWSWMGWFPKGRAGSKHTTPRPIGLRGEHPSVPRPRARLTSSVG